MQEMWVSVQYIKLSSFLKHY